MVDLIFPIDPDGGPPVGSQPVWNGSKWDNQTGGLPKDNTTAFTPDADYEPATKKYVDTHAGPGNIINVKDYGAVGDGTTDDAQSCQDAMDAAVSGDTVYFPAGSYFFGDFWVAIKSNVKVLGDGMGSTTILKGNTLVDQPCFRISTMVKDNGASHTGYTGSKENIEFSHMRLDTNFAASGWVGGARQILIAGNGSDAIKNLWIHHVHFADNDPTATPSGATDETLDCWGILNAPTGTGNENIRISDCVSDTPWHQFLGGGIGNIDGYWVERNFVYHARDNAISVAGNNNGTTYKNVFVLNNRIIGYALNGILAGIDGSSRGINFVVDGLTIRGNIIIADSYKESVVTDLYQSAITVFAPPQGLKGLVVDGNVVIRTADSTSNAHYGMLIGTYNSQLTMTLASTFVQPAEGASVGGITFTSTQNLVAGSILHIGNGAEAGGRYQVVTNASETYTLKRLPWAISSATGATVPVTARLIGEIKNAVVCNNTIDGQFRLDWMTQSIIANNICSCETEIQAIYLQSCYDMDIKNNTLKDGNMTFLYSNVGRCVGNVFGEPSNAGGWIQQKSNTDDLSRETHNEWYMEGNVGKAELSATTHPTTAQSGTGTHKLTGIMRSGRTPEGYLKAEIGTTCIDVLGGVLYIKKIGTSNTGWESGDITLSADGSNYVSISHSNTDAFFKTDDGYFRFETQETDGNSLIQLKGNGTGLGLYRTYDQDDLEYSEFSCLSGYTHIQTKGTSPNGMHLEYNANGTVNLFAGSTDGETEELIIYGYKTGDAKRSLQIGVGIDATDTASFDGVSNYRFDGNIISETGSLTIKEGTTPSAVANYGNLYTKSDNKLYFQDGGGAEHEVSFV